MARIKAIHVCRAFCRHRILRSGRGHQGNNDTTTGDWSLSCPRAAQGFPRTGESVTVESSGYVNVRIIEARVVIQVVTRWMRQGGSQFGWGHGWVQTR